MSADASISLALNLDFTLNTQRYHIIYYLTNLYETNMSTYRGSASIMKEVVLVGMGSHIEIWAKEKYDEVMSATNISELAEELDETGIWI